MNKLTIDYVKTTDITTDVCQIIDVAQKTAFRAVNLALVQRNWLLGKRIAEEALISDKREDNYGLEIIKKLSKDLTAKYGKGYSKRILYQYVDFYRTYPEIVQAVSAQSSNMLSWSHYVELIRVKDSKARAWYEQEAARETWSVRTLQRNIETKYYHRFLSSQVKEPVIDEMKNNTASYQQDKLEFIKNPMVVEFLGLSQDKSFSEKELESSIIDHLQTFIMELGRGYLPTEEELKAEIESQKAIFKLQQSK